MEHRLLDRLFKIREARIRLVKLPLHFENVTTYVTAHYHGNHRLMNLLKKKTRGDALDVSWMEKWYSPAKDLFPIKYRDMIESNITKYLDVMTIENEDTLKNWNHLKESIHSKRYHREFVTALKNLK